MSIVKRVSNFFKGLYRVFSVVSFIGEINMSTQESQVLDELLDLAMRKEIPYSPTQLKKMSEEKLCSIMQKYREQELDKMNEELVDVFFQKYEDILKRVKMIKKDSDLGEKLKERKLLRKDVKSIISSLTPFLPYVGILEGVLLTAGEIYENAQENKRNNESSTSQTKEGEECDKSSTKESSSEE